MTCKRCEDIHSAQKEGKTQKSCECSCHESVGGTLWFNTTSTPDYTFTYTNGNCTCATSSLQCDDCKKQD